MRRVFLFLSAFLISFISVMSFQKESNALILTDGDDTTDFIILYSMGYYLTVVEQEITTFENPDFSSLTPEQPLYIVAHGEIGKVAGYDSASLMTLYATYGLPDYTSTMYFFSCEAGLTDPSHPRSLVQQIAEGLHASDWRGTAVAGPIGCAITNRAYFPEQNSEQVVNPAYFPEMGHLQDSLAHVYNAYTIIPDYIAEFDSINGRNPTVRELAVYAYGNENIRGFFSDLLNLGSDYMYPQGYGFLVFNGLE